MAPLFDKARHALLTDPVSGEPLGARDCASLAIGLVVAIGVIVAMVALALGLGAGR